MPAAYNYRSGGKSYSSGFLKEAKPSREVSVVVPTYNEERSIKRLVSALSSALKGFDFEVVVVDDASCDSTPEIIDRLAASSSGRVAALHRKGIKGIFSALQDGIMVARGRIVVIMDADFSHPPEQVPFIVRELQKGDYDIVVGSRFVKGSVFKAPFARRYGPAVLNFVCRLILGIKVSDIFTGFHAMKKSSFRQVRFLYQSVWGEFDMELLYRAQKAGLKITELPFSYRFRSEGSSKSAGFKVVKYGFAYLRRALQLRIFG